MWYETSGGVMRRTEDVCIGCLGIDLLGQKLKEE
jgi:hypothetical protein